MYINYNYISLLKTTVYTTYLISGFPILPGAQENHSEKK